VKLWTQRLSDSEGRIPQAVRLSLVDYGFYNFGANAPRRPGGLSQPTRRIAPLNDHCSCNPSINRAIVQFSLPDKNQVRGIGTGWRKSKVILVSPEIALKIAMELPIMRRTLVLLDAVTGIRASELLGLQWEDIDWEAGIIQMNRTWRHGYIGEGKTPESRKPVVIGKLMIEFLREWHRETPYAVATDWIFPSMKLKGKKPISGSQFVKDYIRPAFTKYGLIEPEYRGRAGLHAFRHSLASILITQESVDVKTVQEMLRHTNSGFTQGIYTHSQDDAKRKAVERYESRWAAENQITRRESQVEN
jgi:integrase